MAYSPAWDTVRRNPLTPCCSANDAAAPCSRTDGAPASSEHISMSRNGAEATPGTPVPARSALTTASLAHQRAHRLARGSAFVRQVSSSCSVKLRSKKAGESLMDAIGSKSTPMPCGAPPLLTISDSACRRSGTWALTSQLPPCLMGAARARGSRNTLFW